MWQTRCLGFFLLENMIEPVIPCTSLFCYRGLSLGFLMEVCGFFHWGVYRMRLINVELAENFVDVGGWL